MPDSASSDPTITIELRPRAIVFFAVVVFLVLALLVVPVISNLSRDHLETLSRILISVAKIVLSLIMLAMSVPCFWLFLNRNRIVDELCRQEDLAEQARDDSMFELTAVRARLSAIEDRLTRTRRPDPARINKLLVQQAGAAVMMVFQKEQSFIKWGFWAAKLAKSAFDYFRSRRDH